MLKLNGEKSDAGSQEQDTRPHRHYFLQGPMWRALIFWFTFMTWPPWFMAIFMSMSKPSLTNVILLSAFIGVLPLHSIVYVAVLPDILKSRTSQFSGILPSRPRPNAPLS